jgi:hypothetical protein
MTKELFMKRPTTILGLAGLAGVGYLLWRSRPEVKRRQEAAAKEKESNDFLAPFEERSRIAEQGTTMLVSDEGLDHLSENRES